MSNWNEPNPSKILHKNYYEDQLLNFIYQVEHFIQISEITIWFLSPSPNLTDFHCFCCIVSQELNITVMNIDRPYL